MANQRFEAAFAAMIEAVRVELAEEFDLNFERQAFFNETWQRRSSPGRSGGAILIETGRLRRSVKSERRGASVVFSSDHPAAAIHNDGGEIKVTARMKRYFWYRYREATGRLQRRKNGELRQSKGNQRVSALAEFYRAMALKKVGDVIKMPRRRFVGASPEVERIVEEIITRELTAYFDSIDLTDKNI